MPARSAEVVRRAIQNEPITCPVKLVVPSAYTLVVAQKQVFVLVDHSQAQEAIHSYDELGLFHKHYVANSGVKLRNINKFYNQNEQNSHDIIHFVSTNLSNQDIPAH